MSITYKKRKISKAKIILISIIAIIEVVIFLSGYFAGYNSAEQAFKKKTETVIASEEQKLSSEIAQKTEEKAEKLFDISRINYILNENIEMIYIEE